jgi:predicted nucleotidyltransferase
MKKILREIKKLEKENNVKILWAVESGSRAWEFSSEDSDYDIRCMHVGKEKCYLSLHPPKKQINLMQGELDIESWDIKKFTELSLKSNPQIAEWLRSPMIYIDSPIRKKFKKLFDKGCSLEYLRQHYLSMAKQNYYKYLGKDRKDNCKKYLYVLRAIACANFIERKKKIPPLPYEKVILYLPKKIQSFFLECIKQKNKTEKALIKTNKEVIEFIEKNIQEVLKTKPQKNFNFKKPIANKLEDYMLQTILNEK